MSQNFPRKPSVPASVSSLSRASTTISLKVKIWQIFHRINFRWRMKFLTRRWTKSSMMKKKHSASLIHRPESLTRRERIITGAKFLSNLNKRSFFLRSASSDDAASAEKQFASPAPAEAEPLTGEPCSVFVRHVGQMSVKLQYCPVKVYN